MSCKGFPNSNFLMLLCQGMPKSSSFLSTRSNWALFQNALNTQWARQRFLFQESLNLIIASKLHYKCNTRECNTRRVLRMQQVSFLSSMLMGTDGQQTQPYRVALQGIPWRAASHWAPSHTGGFFPKTSPLVIQGSRSGNCLACPECFPSTAKSVCHVFTGLSCVVKQLGPMRSSARTWRQHCQQRFSHSHK